MSRGYGYSLRSGCLFYFIRFYRGWFLSFCRCRCFEFHIAASKNTSGPCYLRVWTISVWPLLSWHGRFHGWKSAF